MKLKLIVALVSNDKTDTVVDAARAAAGRPALRLLLACAAKG